MLRYDLKGFGAVRLGYPLASFLTVTGQPVAEVRVDALPDEVFRGRIARIAPVLDAATRSALIEIDILNPNGVLKAEMFARINLDLGSTREATLIPRDGLVHRGQQPGVCTVEQENQPVFQPIETGLTRENEVEVLVNLDFGTTIAEGAPTGAEAGTGRPAATKKKKAAGT